MTFLHRWKALRHHRLQSALVIAAVAAAVALPVVLLSVGGGVVDHEILALERSGYEVTVAAPGLHGVEDSHALAARIQGLSDVAAASPILSSALDAFPGGGVATPTLAEGILPTAFAATEGPEERSLFSASLPLSAAAEAAQYANGTYGGPADRAVMVSTPFLTEYSLAVGQALPLGLTADRTQATDLTIVGTFGSPAATLGPSAVYALVLPLAELQVLTGLATVGTTLVDASDTVQVAVTPPGSTDAATIEHVAAEIRDLVPYYGVSALTDEAAQLHASAAVLTGFYLALSSVGLIVGLVFLALVLTRRVETDRRWIGVQRALGVPARQIAAEWARTSLLLGGAGSAAGVIGGVVIVALLARLGAGAVATAAQLAVFDPVELGLLFLAVVGLGALASLAATRAALRLPIAEALR
jgi:ABC-type antimicrobial peptide transport system permease subunit